MLSDFNLLDHFPQRSSISSAILSYNSHFLGTFRLENNEGVQQLACYDENMRYTYKKHSKFSARQQEGSNLTLTIVILISN